MSKYFATKQNFLNFIIFRRFLSLVDADGQAKKDLSSHCDQIVMSLATLNKQRASEKQQSQSIKTTVTISSVSKSSIGSTTPIMSQLKRIPLDGSSEKSEPSVASSDSPLTVRAASSTSEEIPFADDAIGRKKELAKVKFMSDGAEISRRGE